MDEGRKRVVLIATAILVARHLKNAEDLNGNHWGIVGVVIGSMLGVSLAGVFFDKITKARPQ